MDGNQAGIPGALVRITNVETRQSQSVNSDSEGVFRFANVTRGSYQLTIEKSGFKKYRASAAVLPSASGEDLNITLQIAEVGETVNIVTRLQAQTASKTDLATRETPVTVNSVSKETIEDQGANDLVSALRNVSGTNAYTNYGVYEYYALRGFAFGNSAYLIDGLRAEGNRVNSQLANVESVEVLKGPASVLYGGEAIGGTINVIRKKPSIERSGEITLRRGGFGKLEFLGGTGGKLGTERLLYRLDGGISDADGWRDNGYRRINFTPSLYAQITSKDRVIFHYSVNRDHFDGDGGIPLLPNGTIPNVPTNRRYNTQQDFARSVDQNFQLNYYHTFNDYVEFRYTGGYRHFDDDYFVTEFLTVQADQQTVRREFLYFKHHRRPFINQSELNARFKVAGIENRLLAGWEFQKYYNFTHRSASASTATTNVDLLNPAETHLNRSFPLSRIDFFNIVTNGFYLQDHLSLHKKFKVLIGGRYDDFDRWSRNDPVVNGVQGVGPRIERNNKAFTYRVGFVFDPTETLSFYGSTSNSYRPNFSVPADGAQLLPEVGTQFELGARAAILNNRINASFAIFDIEKRNVTYSRPGGIFIQAGKQSSRGFETDIEGQLTERWSVLANYSFTEARYDDFFTGTTNLTGNRPSQVPKHLANLWTTYRFENGLSFSLGGRYMSKAFSDIRNRFYLLGGFTTWDAALSYRKGIATISGNINNLLDKKNFFLTSINDTNLYSGQRRNGQISLRLNLK